jgi:hypothetical protein
MKDKELKALFVGIELEKAKRREYSPESVAAQELSELERAERTANRLKSEMSYQLQSTDIWAEIKTQRVTNKENKRKQQTIWFKFKKLLGFV